MLLLKRLNPSSDLLTEQRKAIRSFLQGKNVFVNLPTGFGKSLIFQCLPIFVVQALQSLMLSGSVWSLGSTVPFTARISRHFFNVLWQSAWKELPLKPTYSVKRGTDSSTASLSSQGSSRYSSSSYSRTSSTITISSSDSSLEEVEPLFSGSLWSAVQSGSTTFISLGYSVQSAPTPG